MLTQWLGGFGQKLGESWADRALSPAFAFWAGGLAVWMLRPEGGQGLADAERSISSWSTAVQLLAGIAALALIGATDLVLRALSFSTLRLLEGHWPRFAEPLRRRLVTRVTDAYKRDRYRWAVLSERASPEASSSLTEDEQRELTGLERRLQRVPVSPDQRLPIVLGNLLRATETRIEGRYGLDPIRCWPAFWFVLPEFARSEVAAARAGLDASARVLLAGLLFTVWALVAWWWPPIVIGPIVAIAAYYGWMIPAAATYGSVVEATFAVHRFALYEALHWPLPATPAGERTGGRALTEAIARGSDTPKIEYVQARQR